MHLAHAVLTGEKFSHMLTSLSLFCCRTADVIWGDNVGLARKLLLLDYVKITFIVDGINGVATGVPAPLKEAAGTPNRCRMNV